MKYERTMQNNKTIKDINPIMLPIIYEISLTLFIPYLVPPDGIAPYRYLRPLVRTDIPLSIPYIHCFVHINEQSPSAHSSIQQMDISLPILHTYSDCSPLIP